VLAWVGSAVAGIVFFEQPVAKPTRRTRITKQRKRNRKDIGGTPLPVRCLLRRRGYREKTRICGNGV